MENISTHFITRRGCFVIYNNIGLPFCFCEKEFPLNNKFSSLLLFKIEINVLIKLSGK